MSKQVPFMYKLSKQEIDQFIEIHTKIIPKRKKHFEKKGIFNKSSIQQKELVKPILDKSLDILYQNNIKNIDKTKYYLEFHQRNCGFENKGHQLFDWHIDDDGAISGRVYSILFYLRKDITVKGGDLDYKIQKNIYTHNVKPGDIIQFRGDFNHRPQRSSGFGCRDLIVVFIRRN